MDSETCSGRPLDKAIKTHEQAWFLDSLDSVLEWLRLNASDCWPPASEAKDESDRSLVAMWDESPILRVQYIANLAATMHQAFDVLFGKKVNWTLM